MRKRVKEMVGREREGGGGGEETDRQTDIQSETETERKGEGREGGDRESVKGGIARPIQRYEITEGHRQRERTEKRQTDGLFVGWLLNVPATCSASLGERQTYRERQRERERNGGRGCEGPVHRDTNRNREIEIHREKETETDRQTK